jgi:hemerythrin-like metal-binding protein
MSVPSNSQYTIEVEPPAAFDPHLLIGEASIDNEHRRLFELLRCLKAMPGAAPNSTEFTDVLCRLIIDLPAHFRTEEKIIRSCGMPAAQVQEHLEAHLEIVRQFAELNLELMYRNPLRADVLRMIGDWVINHITRHDLLLKDYLPTPP